jgi:hypothetical protein
LFDERLFSSRLPKTEKDEKIRRNNILLIKKAVAIQNNFNEIFAKEPNLEDLRSIWNKRLNYFLNKLRNELRLKISKIDFEVFEQFLAERNIFIFYFSGATISGLATKNFIFINKGESKSRQVWTLFHELLHILNEDFSFRTPHDKRESSHEEEVGSFLIEDFLPKEIGNIKPNEVDNIVEEVFKKHPLKIHKYAIKKWISKKLGIKPKFERFNKKDGKSVLKEKYDFKLIPSQPYLQLIEPFKKKDLEVYAALQGLSLEELLIEQPEF